MPLADKTCDTCSEGYTPTSARQRYCKRCVPHKKARRLMNRYGLTWDRYLAAIANPCPLCGSPATVIDHDHQTGRTRDALCNGCNIALSRFETEGWKARASTYLEEHECRL